MNKYQAKILLFGEYTIILGSDALAMPLSNFSGSWSYEESVEKEKSGVALWQLYNFLKASFQDDYDLVRMKKELELGLWFDSSIPGGYGVGSSGAVCAAVYDRYSIAKTTNLIDLQEAFSNMESFFHGASSGLDPLVTYTGKSLLFSVKSDLKVVNVPDYSSSMQLFLIDSEISRSTGPLVTRFKNKLKESEEFSLKIIPSLEEANKNTIQAFLENEPEQFWKGLETISNLQFQHFNSFIPDAFQEIWKKGLESKTYFLKLCGAGGGGFILGFSKVPIDKLDTSSTVKCIAI